MRYRRAYSAGSAVRPDLRRDILARCGRNRERAYTAGVHNGAGASGGRGNRRRRRFRRR